MNVEFVPHKKITVNQADCQTDKMGTGSFLFYVFFIKNILIYNNRYVYGMWCNVSSNIEDLPARYRIY